MIHQYKLNGYNIVIDIGSGSIHVVDELVYDIIEAYGSTDKDALIGTLLIKYKSSPDITRHEIEAAIADVEALRDDGKLFTPDSFESIAGKLQNNSGEIKALCLHVAHVCNLMCSYCFAGAGKYRGVSALMSFETGKRAIDFLVENSGKRHNLEVDFFGGEPLMNWDVVKQIVGYARSIEKKRGKNFRFTLTTNGVLIDDDVISFSNKEMHNVVLSLDGRKEVHDRLRKTPDGQGSYDVIVPKFQKLIKERGDKEYYIRGTFTQLSRDFTNDIFHMADLGFKELSMEPVISKKDAPYALTENDLPVLIRQYEILAEEMLRREKEGRGFNFYHYMLDLENGPCIHKRIRGCGSGTEYLAVTPSGELYPCHQFVGDTGFRMGDIWKGIANTTIRDKFLKCNTYSRRECRDCWARLYCAGGCAANAFHAVGEVSGVYDYGCRLFKKRVECAIMIKAAQAMKNVREA